MGTSTLFHTLNFSAESKSRSIYIYIYRFALLVGVSLGLLAWVVGGRSGCSFLLFCCLVLPVVGLVVVVCCCRCLLCSFWCRLVVLGLLGFCCLVACLVACCCVLACFGCLPWVLALFVHERLTFLI